MKKILLFLLLFSGFLLSAVDQERSWKLSPLQIGLGISDFKNLADQSADTVFTFGLWYMEQKSAVISFSTCTEFQNNYGIQLSILQALSDKNYGIMTGFTKWSTPIACPNQKSCAHQPLHHQYPLREEYALQCQRRVQRFLMR